MRNIQTRSERSREMEIAAIFFYFFFNEQVTIRLKGGSAAVYLA